MTTPDQLRRNLSADLGIGPNSGTPAASLPGFELPLVIILGLLGAAAV